MSQGPSQPRQQSRAATPQTSQTTTQTSEPEVDQEPSAILRLRGVNASSNGRSVQWAEDVVDNEGLGRKSSKVCCIYHKPKAVGESSDESDSSSSDSDFDSDDEPNNRNNSVGRGHDHSHDGKKADSCGHSHGRGRAAKKPGKGKRPPSPNAYEKVPKTKSATGPTDKS